MLQNSRPEQKFKEDTNISQQKSSMLYNVV